MFHNPPVKVTTKAKAEILNMAVVKSVLANLSVLPKAPSINAKYTSNGDEPIKVKNIDITKNTIINDIELDTIDLISGFIV